MPGGSGPEPPVISGGRKRPARRRRVVLAVLLLTMAAGLALLAGLWPRLVTAAREVDLMRRGLGRQATQPVRRPAVPGETPLVLSSVQIARRITPDGKPLDPTKTLSTQDRNVYVFFEYEGAPEGAALSSDWFLDGRYQAVTMRPVPLPAGEGHGHLQLCLAEAEKLPAGAYRVDLVFGDTVAGHAEFTVETGGP